jgi:hypothetical protein
MIIQVLCSGRDFADDRRRYKTIIKNCIYFDKNTISTHRIVFNHIQGPHTGFWALTLLSFLGAPVGGRKGLG